MSERLRQIYLPGDPGAGASAKECRNRATELEAADRARRLAAAQKMSSPALEPIERIRLWETIHRICLPRQRNHALIGVIAAQTGLSVEAVVAEQARRFCNPR
jgi:hypothetical protein